MTWSELYNLVRAKTSREEFAANIIGHLMDDYDSYNWEDEIPEGADYVLK